VRRLHHIDVRDDTFDALARRALAERRSLRDQAAVELERLFPASITGESDDDKPAVALPMPRVSL
jgi:hypothetical protein